VTGDLSNGWLRRVGSLESVNFWLTNRVPRRMITLAVGRLSKVEHPWVSGACLALWRAFTDLELEDAQRLDFRSMHDCFTRKLRPGARPVDPRPEVVASPSDGLLGTCGSIRAGTLFQAKDSSYALADLLGGDRDLAAGLEGGVYTTLRLTSAMYHRFHAPHDVRVSRVTYVSGDAYNVNPAALARIPRLFCRNERAIVRCELDDGAVVALVPVAAILVASIRLNFLDVTLHLRHRGPNEMPCDVRLAKGEEMGWFEHGSTIIVLAPAGFRLRHGLEPGCRLRAGEGLLERV